MTIVCSRCDGNHMRSECPEDSWRDVRSAVQSDEAVLAAAVRQEEPATHSGLLAQGVEGPHSTVEELEAEIGILMEKLSDALAAGLPHWSDCAVNRAPAREPGPCDCGAAQQPAVQSDEYTKGYREGWNDREARAPAQEAGNCGEIERLQASNDQRGNDLVMVIAQRDAAEAALRAQEAREPVDITGWKLVPDDPTEAMWQAGRTADIHPGDSYSKVWRAMWNAAPDVDDCETTSGAAQTPFNGTVELSAEEFDALEKTMLEPQEPTESIKRGAALLDKLYGGRVPAQEAKEPVVWVAFAENGLVRFWTTDKTRAVAEMAAGVLHMEPYTVDALMGMVARTTALPSASRGTEA